MSTHILEPLSYKNQCLHWNPGEIDLSRWAGEDPVYLYNLKQIQSRFELMKKSWPEAEIFYAMKANSHPEVLRTLKKSGSGADVVSGGEIRRALENGFSPRQIVFSGVGKSSNEISYSIDLNLYQINVESVPELLRISQISRQKNKKISISLRINPNMSIDTHPYIATGLNENKFGIEISEWPEIKKILKTNHLVELCGLSLHLGSQMLEFSGWQEALRKTKDFYLEMKKDFSTVERFDVGGGLGIFYDKQDFAAEEKLLQQYVEISRKELASLKARIQTEPGRWLVAHAGVILARVEYVKKTSHKNFLIVNTGMHHLLRPSLYEAFHQILPLKQIKGRDEQLYDVVGPICESADFLGKARRLPEVREGEHVVLLDTGAYGFSMSSDYNLQTPAQEICL